jgi:RNA polymerase sigma-70 factor (ECF subfamily)
VIDRGTDGDHRTDAELLQAHVEGDPDAFAELVARHQDRMWAIALRIMRNRDDAADALQMPISLRSAELGAIEGMLR